MIRFFTLGSLMLIIIMGIVSNRSFGQAIFSNPITDPDPSASNPFTTGQSLVPNISVSGIGRSVGITAIPTANRYNAKSWNVLSLDVNRYFEFILTPAVGYQIDFVSFVYNSTASMSGPTTVAIRSSIDGFTSDIGSPTTAGLTTVSLSSSSYQGITSAVIFRVYAWGTNTAAGTFSIDDFKFNGAVTQVPKFYRSTTSGNWANTSTWESSLDSSFSSWGPASFPPAATDKHITIQASHIVIASTSISLDETTVNGTLQVVGSGVLNINNGINDDIFIGNNGILQILTAATYTAAIVPASSVSINIATGGKIEIGDGVATIGTGYEAFATTTSNVWNNRSTFEWNTTTLFPLTGNIKYFPNVVAEIPNFLVSKTTTPLSVATATINGLTIVNTDLTLNSTSGVKTFRDGISGNAVLTLNATGGSYTITSPTAIIGGTVTINLNKDLSLSTGVTIPSGASVNIFGSSTNNIVKGMNGDFIVDGTVDMHLTNISNYMNTGSVIVNGTLKTSSPSGFFGSSAATVTDGVVKLNINSTIEYNANGPQSVQGAILPLYYNVIFSGSGIKTLISNNNPAGTITVSGSTIFDAKNFTFGDSTTNLTMTGTSRYINGGSTTKPDAQGTYNLGINTTIEFANTSGLIIRLGQVPLFYANVVVSGTDVSNASTVTGIKFQAGGKFTVKTGATFKLDNTAGFTGSSSTAIDNTNNPAIVLEDGSTVEYSGAGNQTITNQTTLPYSNLKFSGSGNKNAPAAILTVKGNVLKAGTSIFVPGSGTVLLDGTAPQSFAGLTYNNLILTNSTKTTQGNSTILDSLKVNATAILDVSNVLPVDTIIIHSDAVKTGRIAQVDGMITPTSRFTVERFIPARRAWRFLAMPTNSSLQTIKSAWQEGATNRTSDPKPGYGTQFQINNVNWKVKGFDTISINGPSIKTYDYTTDTYKAVDSMQSKFDTSLGGYMTFIRGDRTASYFGAAVTKTVLRTTGNLFTGNLAKKNVLHGKIIPVNNPYASPIDLRKLSTSSYNIFYYLWDPNRGGTYGLGAIQTLSWNGSHFVVVPGGGSYGPTNDSIESGQAFFVSTLGVDTTIQITEGAKVSTSPAIIPFVPVTSPMQLHTNLYTVNSDGTTALSDGVLTGFANNYNNGIDGMDAKKLSNNIENLSFKSHNELLAIERRPTIINADTLSLNLTGTSLKQYRFELIADNFNQPGLKAYLEDKYLNTHLPLDLTGSTFADFTVDPSDTVSSAADRFRIIFNLPAAAPLPVTLTNVNAYQKNENVSVEWTVSNEDHVKQYDVEKSADGNFFNYTVTLVAKNLPSNTYKWLDEDALTGYNYYRIKIVDAGGAIKYSKIVKVLMGERKRDITVYPNPIKNGIINLQLINQPAGSYGLKLLNNLGQTILQKQINHSTGTSIEKISLDKNEGHGIYNLEITKPGTGKIIRKILY